MVRPIGRGVRRRVRAGSLVDPHAKVAPVLRSSSDEQRDEGAAPPTPPISIGRPGPTPFGRRDQALASDPPASDNRRQPAGPALVVGGLRTQDSGLGTSVPVRPLTMILRGSRSTGATNHARRSCRWPNDPRRPSDPSRNPRLRPGSRRSSTTSRRPRRSTSCPSFWRVLATNPDHLELIWSRLKAIMHPEAVGQDRQARPLDPRDHRPGGLGHQRLPVLRPVAHGGRPQARAWTSRGSAR